MRLHGIRECATTDACASHTIRTPGPLWVSRQLKAREQITETLYRDAHSFMCARCSCVHNAEHRPAERNQQQPFLPPTSAPFPTWLRVYGLGMCSCHQPQHPSQPATWPHHMFEDPRQQLNPPRREYSNRCLRRSCRDQLPTTFSPSHTTHTHSHTHHTLQHSSIHTSSISNNWHIQALQQHKLFLVLWPAPQAPPPRRASLLIFPDVDRNPPPGGIHRRSRQIELRSICREAPYASSLVHTPPQARAPRQRTCVRVYIWFLCICIHTCVCVCVYGLCAYA